MEQACFHLKSDYQPSGDQPEAIEQLVEGLNQGEKGQVLLGVTGSGKTFTMANVIARVNRPTLVLAHNHPNGTAMPSPEDIAATQKIFNVLKSVGIRLVDHIIVAGEHAVSLKEYGAFSLLD